MKECLKARPMLFAAILSVIAAIIGFYSHLLIILSGITVILLIGYFLLYKKNGVTAFSLFIVFCVIISVLLCGKKEAEYNCFINTSSIGEFTVIEQPKSHNKYYSSVVKVNKADNIKKGIKILLFYKGQDLNLGDIISGEVKVSSVKDSKYRSTNLSENIFLTGFSSGSLEKVGRDFILNKVYKVRNYISNLLFSRLSYKEAATLNALLYGNKSFITNVFSQNIIRAGVSHVMVVSGMHLAIIISLFISICERFFYKPVVNFLIIIFVVIFISFLCGFTMSILRAGLTYIIIAVAMLVKRDNTPENSLGAAISIILIFSPFAVLNLSFQLSALSTFGILCFAIPFNRKIRNKKYLNNKFLYAIVSSVIITLSALIMTLPVTIYNFKMVSLVSVITNILVSFAVTFSLSFAILGIIFNLISAKISYPFFFVSGILSKYINFIIEKTGELKYSSLNVNKYLSILFIIIIIVCLNVLITCKRKANMIKSKRIINKVIKEGGNKLKWQ